MLLLLLPKRKVCSIILSVFSAHHSPLLNHCLCSSSAITQNLHTNFSLDDYLMASFGFSPDKAARISKPIAHLKSPDKPDAVRRYLNHQGFSEPDIKKLITWRPQILCSSPENTLDPNLRALRDMGVSISSLTQLILSHPDTLHVGAAVPRIKFWRDFFGGNEITLVKVFKNNSGIIGHDIGRVILPKISLLQSHGLTTVNIKKIILTVRQFITKSVPLMEDLLTRAKELGFQPKSTMFVSALQAMNWVSRESLQKKMELLKSFGWSENEFNSALQKCPTFITLTTENLRITMDFLLGEGRCDPSYTALNPQLLKYSLEKRLRPRQHVLHLLESHNSYCRMGYEPKPAYFHPRFLLHRIVIAFAECLGLEQNATKIMDRSGVQSLPLRGPPPSVSPAREPPDNGGGGHINENLPTQ